MLSGINYASVLLAVVVYAVVFRKFFSAVRLVGSRSSL
jgi:hypothetical protein